MFHELTIRFHPRSHRAGQASPRRGGFTLVELLVVIGIIAILMALLSPVIYLAIVRAQEVRILAEVTSLDGAIKSFKEKYGAYPPSDFSNMATNGPVGLFLSKAFPNCNVQTELTWITSGTSTGTLTPSAGARVLAARIFPRLRASAVESWQRSVDAVLSIRPVTVGQLNGH